MALVRERADFHRITYETLQQAAERCWRREWSQEIDALIAQLD